MLKYINHLKNKKGSMAVEIVIGCLIFIMLMCFFLDVTILMWKYSVISQTNTYLARTVGIQGGVCTSAPDGFPGGNTAYVSSSELYSKIQDNFNSAGIEPDDFSVYVNGTKVATSTNLRVDYRDYLNTMIKVDYSWSFVNNFIPGSLQHTITSKRAVMSEFKYRYDSWIGE